MPHETLLPGRDYTIESGLYVFTADYLRRRGYCCENACRNCPYGFGGSAARLQTPRRETSADGDSR